MNTLDNIPTAYDAVIWLVEDDDDAAAIAGEMCDERHLASRRFQNGADYRQALANERPPRVLVLDWRLTGMVSASLYLFTRNAYPSLPVICWTSASIADLPASLVKNDRVRVVQKSEGVNSFWAALDWATAAGDQSG